MAFFILDIFYNSVELSEFLLNKKIHTVGTLPSNRGEPNETKNLGSMAKHEVIAKNNGKVTVLAWKDKRKIQAITTKHNGTLHTISKQKKDQVEVKKPICICECNEYMLGVNHVHKMISYYLCTRKTLR